MYKIKMRKKISTVKDMKQALSLNIQDGYDCGYYNGIEFVLSQLEEREPNYLNPDNYKTKHKQDEQQEEETIRGRTMIKGVRRLGGG